MTVATLRVVWRSVNARTRNLAGVLGVVHLADRIALLALAAIAPTENRTLVTTAAVVFGSLTLVRAVVGSAAQGAAQSILHQRTGEALLARDLFRPSALLDDDPEAALLDGMDAGARIAAAALPSAVADFCGAIIVSLFLVRRLEPQLLAAGLGAIFVAAVVLLWSRRITIQKAEDAWAAHRPVLDRLVAILTGRLEIVANGADGSMRRGLAEAAEHWRVSLARFERASAVTGRLPLLFAAFVLAGVFVTRSALPARELALHAVVLAAALPPFAGAIRGIHELTKLAVRVSPLARLLEPQLAQDGAIDAGPAPVTPAPASLALDQASYRYVASGPDALCGASCELARGTVTVLVGPNGCGKSTLLRLLLGIERLREGRLLVDGRPLEGDGRSLRAHVAYLPQRPFLSDRTSLREAFALLAPDYREDAALAWLDRFGLTPALTAKAPSDLLSVRVGELSSGQKQRLALARVGVLDRPIWLLDEPDASIDAEGLTRLESILDEERARRLVVVAAHTPGLRRIADRVMSMEAGRIRPLSD